jgi:hypothetical protein
VRTSWPLERVRRAPRRGPSGGAGLGLNFRAFDTLSQRRLPHPAGYKVAKKATANTFTLQMGAFVVRLMEIPRSSLL